MLLRLCGQPTRSWLRVQDFELDAAYELGMLRGRWVRRLAESWKRSVLRGFDRVCSISNAMVQRLGQKGVASERTTLLPYWLISTSSDPKRARSGTGTPIGGNWGSLRSRKCFSIPAR